MNAVGLAVPPDVSVPRVVGGPLGGLGDLSGGPGLLVIFARHGRYPGLALITPTVLRIAQDRPLTRYPIRGHHHRIGDLDPDMFLTIQLYEVVRVVPERGDRGRIVPPRG